MTNATGSDSRDAVAVAVERSARWAVQRIGANGFRGCSDSLLAHYKAPFCLARVGAVPQAARVFRHVAARFLEDGDFHRDVAERPLWTGGTYANAWLASGAALLGLDGVARDALDRIEASIDPGIGAPPERPTRDAAAAMYDGGTAARAIESFLNAGRLDAALRVGRFLKSLYDRQAVDAAHVTWCVDARNLPYLPDGPAGDAPGLMIAIGRPGQVYWFLGFALRVLARLHRVDGDPGWLGTAHRVRGWLDRCHPERTACISNAKLGWGAAEMYAVTGERAWADIARAVADWLLAGQTASGVWVRRPQYADEASQPLAVSLDTTVERMMYLLDIERAMALGAPAASPA